MIIVVAIIVIIVLVKSWMVNKSYISSCVEILRYYVTYDVKNKMLFSSL